MLYLYEPLQLQDARGNTVTAYPDSHEDNVFYPIASVPRFREDGEGNPIFRLIKFRGGTDSNAPRVELPKETGGANDELPANSVPVIDGEIAGGFLLFDTEFSLDEESTEKVRLDLDAIVRAKYTAAGREIPEGFRIVLRQPRWTDGSVEILMEDTANGLFESVSKAGKPSLMGDNVSSVAAVLRPWQASLIEGAFTSGGGGFSPIQVAYNLKFLAKLPPVRINIYSSAYDQYSMYKEYGNHPNRGRCKNRDKVVRGITEHAYSRDVVRITIDSGGLTIDDETFKQLQEFAMSQLQQWIQKQFLKEPPERATKEEIQNFTLQSLNESDFSSLSINIEQSATVEIPINPQGTLETLVRGGVDLSQYIVEIDLDKDEFYQNRDASIKVYADFPAADAEVVPSDLLFVEVTLRYGDNTETHTWDPQGSADTTANGGRWDVSWHKIPDVNDIEWEARVFFREPGHEYTLGPVTTDKTEINIAVPLPGRARLQLREEGVPWDIVQYIHAKVEYIDNQADPQHLEKELVLNGESDEVFIDEVIWTQRKEPFWVTLTYNFKNGNVYPESPQRERVIGDIFVVESPIERWLTIPIVARYVNAEWDEDILKWEYRDPDNNYIRDGEIHLSEEGGWNQNLVIPLIDIDRDRYRYQWLRRRKSGAIYTSADPTGAPADGWLDARGSEIIYTGHVDDETGDMLRVAVDPLIFLVGVDEGELVRAVVHLSRAESSDVDDHIFTANNIDAWWWKEFLADPDNKEYAWWAEYYTKNPFRRIYLHSEDNPEVTMAETIMLTPPEG